MQTHTFDQTLGFSSAALRSIHKTKAAFKLTTVLLYPRFTQLSVNANKLVFHVGCV